MSTPTSPVPVVTEDQIVANPTQAIAATDAEIAQILADVGQDGAAAIAMGVMATVLANAAVPIGAAVGGTPGAAVGAIIAAEAVSYNTQHQSATAALPPAVQASVLAAVPLLVAKIAPTT